jgi:HPt (histidine-containing phosphotransfer) domain-containing protein
VLDTRVLAALHKVEQASGQAGLVRQVIGLYLEETPAHLAALREAVAQRADGEIEELAHSLVGSAAQVGAMHLAALSAELQSGAHDLDGAAAQVARLVSESRRVRAALQIMLQNSTFA